MTDSREDTHSVRHPRCQPQWPASAHAGDSCHCRRAKPPGMLCTTPATVPVCPPAADAVTLGSIPRPDSR